MAQIIKGGLIGPTQTQANQTRRDQRTAALKNLSEATQNLRSRQNLKLEAAKPGLEEMLADFAGSENLLAREDPQALFDYYNTIYGPVKAAKMVAEKTQGNLSADAERMNTALSILRGETLPGYEGFRNAWSAETDTEKYAAMQDYQKSLEEQIAAAKEANPEADTSTLEEELYYANFATQRYDEDTGEFVRPSRVEPTNRWLNRQMGKENWSTWGVPAQEKLEEAAVAEVKSDAALNKMDQNRGAYPQGYGGTVSLGDFASPQYPAVPSPVGPTPIVNNARAAVPPGAVGANNTSDVNRLNQPVLGSSRTPVRAEGSPSTQNGDPSRSTVPGMLPYDLATRGQDAHHPTAVGEGEGIINFYAMQQPGVAELVATLNAKYPNPAAELAPETVPGPDGQPMPNQFVGTTAAILGGIGAVGNLLGNRKEDESAQNNYVPQSQVIGPGANNVYQQPYPQMPTAAYGQVPVRASGSESEDFQQRLMAAQHAGYQSMPPMSEPLKAIPGSIASQNIYDQMMAAKNAEQRALYEQYPNLARKYPLMAFNQQNVPRMPQPMPYEQTLPYSNYGFVNEPEAPPMPVQAAGQVPPGQAMGLGPGMGYGPGNGQGMGMGYGPQNGYPCVNQPMPVMAPGSVYYNDPRQYAYPQVNNPQNATTSIFYPEGGQPVSATPEETVRGNMETFGNRQADARAEIRNNVGEWWDTTKENVGGFLKDAGQLIKEGYELRKEVETSMPGFGEGEYALVSNEVLENNPDKYELAADTSGSLGAVPPGMNYVKLKEEAPPVWGYSMGPPSSEQPAPTPEPTPEPKPQEEETTPTPQEQKETLDRVKKTARWLSMDNRRFGGKSGAAMNEQVANMLFPEGLTLEDLASTTDKSIEARRKRDEFNEAIRQYNQNYALERNKLAETKAYHDAQIAAKNALETWSKQNPEKWDEYKYNRELVDKAYVRAFETAKGDPTEALKIMSEYMREDEALRTAVNNSSRMMAEVLGDSSYPAWIESEGKDPGFLLNSWYKMKDLLNPMTDYEDYLKAYKEANPGEVVETTVPLKSTEEGGQSTTGEFDQATFDEWFNRLF